MNFAGLCGALEHKKKQKLRLRGVGPELRLTPPLVRNCIQLRRRLTRDQHTLLTEWASHQVPVQPRFRVQMDIFGGVQRCLWQSGPGLVAPRWEPCILGE